MSTFVQTRLDTRSEDVIGWWSIQFDTYVYAMFYGSCTSFTRLNFTWALANNLRVHLRFEGAIYHHKQTVKEDGEIRQTKWRGSGSVKPRNNQRRISSWRQEKKWCAVEAARDAGRQFGRAVSGVHLHNRWCLFAWCGTCAHRRQMRAQHASCPLLNETAAKWREIPFREIALPDKRMFYGGKLRFAILI